MGYRDDLQIIFLLFQERIVQLQSLFGNIEILCNGITTDSGSVSEGSSPSISTKISVMLIFILKYNDGGVAQLVRASDS